MFSYTLIFPRPQRALEEHIECTMVRAPGLKCGQYNGFIPRETQGKLGLVQASVMVLSGLEEIRYPWWPLLLTAVLPRVFSWSRLQLWGLCPLKLNITEMGTKHINLLS